MYKRQPDVRTGGTGDILDGGHGRFDAILYVVVELVPTGTCLLYTSDAADDLLCVDLGGRRIIKKKKNKIQTKTKETLHSSIVSPTLSSHSTAAYRTTH